MQLKLFGKEIPIYLIVTSSSLLSKGVTSILGIISIRILTDQLSDASYALIVLMTNIFVWFTFFDFGIGYSLQNYISESNAKNKSSSGYIFWGCIFGIVLFALGAIGFYYTKQFLGEAYLGKIEGFSSIEKSDLFFYGCLMWLSNITGDIAYKIWYAQNKGYIANLLVGLARVISFIGIVILTYYPDLSKTQNYLIMSILPLGSFPFFCLFYHLYHHRKGYLQDSFEVLKNLLKRGYKFWIFLVFLYIPYQTDYLFISQYLNETSVVEYNFLKKIFDMIFFIYLALLSALWPEYAEALAKNKWKETLAKTKKYLLIGMGYLLLATVVFLVFSDTLKSLLMPKADFVASVGLILMMGCFFFFKVWNDSFQVILQSINALKTLIPFSLIYLILNVLIQWYTVEEWGLYGIILGLIVPMLLTGCWAYPRKVYQLARKSKEIE